MDIITKLFLFKQPYTEDASTKSGYHFVFLFCFVLFFAFRRHVHTSVFISEAYARQSKPKGGSGIKVKITCTIHHGIFICILYKTVLSNEHRSSQFALTLTHFFHHTGLGFILFFVFFNVIKTSSIVRIKNKYMGYNVILCGRKQNALNKNKCEIS